LEAGEATANPIWRSNPASVNSQSPKPFWRPSSVSDRALPARAFRDAEQSELRHTGLDAGGWPTITSLARGERVTDRALPTTRCQDVT